jgi:GNAT superfamily N-acetyltransferase|tara:strand:- start:3434 stop:4225 length:792 start_codon:yes stop_codon:yes gene_type:complete
VFIIEETIMHIDSANLNNLKTLWQRYGARLLYEDDNGQLRKSISWPNRAWANIAWPVSVESLEQTGKVLPNGTLFPLWPMMSEDGSASPRETVDALVDNSCDWQRAFQHTAMVLPLDKQQHINTQEVRFPISIKRLSDEADIAAWVATGSKAFGYSIDSKVIVPLLDCEDIQILLAYNKNLQPVATGLLFKTGDVVGIHQIGVPGDHRGKGYATQMMRLLIERADKWQANYVVLQASEAGRLVYHKLGFVDQFLITYLKKYKS